MSRDGVIELTNRSSPARRSAAARKRRSSPRVSSRRALYEPTIVRAARLYRLPPALISAVIHVESHFNPAAVSRANAQGLMQLIPSTAERMMVRDAFDPEQNILGGARYLRVLANRFGGDLRLTLAAYNAGEGAVSRYKGVPPYRETRAYIQRVMTYYNLYRNQS